MNKKALLLALSLLALLVGIAYLLVSHASAVVGGMVFVVGIGLCVGSWWKG